jgi:rare lipoprotein A
MHRLFSRVAMGVILGLLCATPSQADSWSDSFSSSHQYSTGTWGGRSNLGAMTDGNRRAHHRRQRTARASLGTMDDSGPVVATRRPARADSTAARHDRRVKHRRVARATPEIADDSGPSVTGPRARSGRSKAARGGAGGVASGGSGGIASYYWQPQRVASGGWFNPNAMTAAHKTLPFGTRVRVTNRSNGRSAVVTINDRGPFIAGRVIDLSKAAAGAVGMIGSGLARVTLEILGR